MAQSTSIARSETTSRRTQDHSFDAATMSPPEQLGDRTAHRVSHANKAIDHERIRECRNVIGTIRESERDSDPHPPSVTAMIDDQYAIGATERLEYRSPVEQACRAETMQEQQGRRIRRPCGLAHENLAATRKRDSSFSPTHRRRICIGMTSSITLHHEGSMKLHVLPQCIASFSTFSDPSPKFLRAPPRAVLQISWNRSSGTGKHDSHRRRPSFFPRSRICHSRSKGFLRAHRVRRLPAPE